MEYECGVWSKSVEYANGYGVWSMSVEYGCGVGVWSME